MRSLHLFLYVFIVLFSTSILARENLQDDSNPLISEHKKDSWTGIDKVQHFMYSLSVSFGAQYILVNKFN